MADLTTTFMGLDLKSPVIVGSSGLTYTAQGIKRMEDAGAGAVVVKSIFEEQILIETDPKQNVVEGHPEAHEYFDTYMKEHHLSHYLDVIREAKDTASIPVIASINCVSDDKWVEFAARLEDAGADALELNYFILPSDPGMDDLHVENTLFDIVKSVRKHTSVPIAVKLSPHFSNFANTLMALSHMKVQGITLFNRFYNPDINIDKLKLEPGDHFSDEDDYRQTLRWMAIGSGFLRGVDLSASFGIHNGEAVVKMLLAGAQTAQMVSAIYRNKPESITKALDFVTKWMDEKKFAKVEDFRGRLSQKRVDRPNFFERVQFMKHYGQL